MAFSPQSEGTKVEIISLKSYKEFSFLRQVLFFFSICLWLCTSLHLDAVGEGFNSLAVRRWEKTLNQKSFYEEHLTTPELQPMQFHHGKIVPLYRPENISSFAIYSVYLSSLLFVCF